MPAVGVAVSRAGISAIPPTSSDASETRRQSDIAADRRCSVALKWVLPEEDSELAEELLERGGPLHAPAFIFVELANAIWFKMRAGTLDLAKARGCLQDLREAPLQLWAGEEPLPSALEWAHRLDHAVYDCAYLALALHLGGRYVTADRRFWQKARARADLREQVMLLTDLELSPPG